MSGSSTDTPARPRQSGLSLLAKRALDVLAASVGLVLASPLLLAGAIAVRVSMGAPVLFTQVRPGRQGKPFRVVKFRTMRDLTGSDGTPLLDDERITRVGRLLRSSSIDELPQLWNVIRGELSLVGPRPLLVQYLPLYTKEQARRHEVLPGITGWAQVNGRNAISWDEKFALDVWYVDHWSLALDARILVMTIVKVFRREGISREGHVTTPVFMGSRKTGEER